MRMTSVLCVCLGVLACGRSQQASLETSGRDWAGTRDTLIEAYLAANPAFAVSQGRHEYDGKLPDWSAAGLAAEIARLRSARQTIAALTGLDEDARFERDYFVAVFDNDLFWIDTVGFPFTNPAWYLSGLDPAPYITRTYAPLAVRLRAYTDYARAVPRALGQIRANLRTPLARPLAERGISGFAGLADFYTTDVPKVFAEVEDKALQQAFSEANTTAANAMRELAEWLKSQLPTATGEYALGPAAFARMLRDTERVDTPLAELEAAGRADMERNQQALAEACRAYAPGASVSVCIAKMQANKISGGVVEGARAQLAGLKTFLTDAGVVSIPGTEEALVAESPPYNRANSAYISIPGPYEKGQSSIYYISPPDPAWTPQEQREYIPGRADLLFTSVHEVWPGHFLQFLHSNRSPSLVGRLFVGYAFAEGWGHYAEEMTWEMGLGKGDPETHIGQLSNALLRNARFLSAIGLHTQGMTVADSEKLFRDGAYTDIGTARQQAARGTYDPAYLNYTMGKLMIRKLRADWTASRGGRDAWRMFHDELLKYGGPPIPMIRERMLGTTGGTLF